MDARRCRWCGLPDSDPRDLAHAIRVKWNGLDDSQRAALVASLRARAPEVLALVVSSARIARAQAAAAGDAAPAALEVLARETVRAAAPALRAWVDAALRVRR